MLKDYLDEQLGAGQPAPPDTIYDCPFCSRRKLYVVTEETVVDDNDTNNVLGVYHCFHCGASGSPTKLIASIENLSFSQAKLRLREIDDALVTTATMVVDDATPEESLLAVLIRSQQQPKETIESEKVDLTKVAIPDKLPPDLPHGLGYLENDADKPEVSPYVNYLNSRGFTWEDIVYNHIGYIEHGGAFSAENKFFPINKHVVFFCYDEKGDYQYWNTRAIYPSNPKSINAPETPDHLGKGDVIYNLYPALANNTVVLVEGVPDAMTLGANAVATYGKGLTDVQKALLINNLKPSQNLAIMLDMDAWEEMTALAIELYKYHENTYIVYNPTRQDANALGAQRAWEIIGHNSIKATPQGIDSFSLLSKFY